MNKLHIKRIVVTIWVVLVGYVFGHSLGHAVAEGDWINTIITAVVLISAIYILSTEWKQRQLATSNQ